MQALNKIFCNQIISICENNSSLHLKIYNDFPITAQTHYRYLGYNYK